MSSEPRVAYAFEQLPPAPPGSGGASDLLADAWAQAEQIREQARLTGEADGREAGLRAGREEIDSAVTALASALDQVQQLRSDLVAVLEHDAVELAFSLSERILSAALEVQPERVLDVARNALRRATERNRVTLVVNPDDLDLVVDSVQRLRGELGGIEHCDVQSDRRVARGGVILRTEAGEIDVTIDTQLDRAREIVAEAIGTGGDRG